MPPESFDPAGVKQGKQLVSRVISGKPVLSMVMNQRKAIEILPSDASVRGASATPSVDAVGHVIIPFVFVHFPVRFDDERLDAVVILA